MPQKKKKNTALWWGLGIGAVVLGFAAWACNRGNGEPPAPKDQPGPADESPMPIIGMSRENWGRYARLSRY